MPSSVENAHTRPDCVSGEGFAGILDGLRPIELRPLPGNPLVSVLTANYNYARFIGKAIESVIAQSYANFELVICDDGSTDNSVGAIEEFTRRDVRIRLVRKRNGGMASALNTAYKESNGEIVCLLDSDDRYLPEKLQTVVRTFQENPESGYLVHKLVRIDAGGRQGGIHPLLARLPSGWFAPQIIRNAGESPQVPPCSGLCLRRQVADRAFPIPEVFRSGADAVVQALAPLATPMVGINVPLAEWREHGANLTTTSSLTPQWIDRELQIQNDIWKRQRSYLDEAWPTAAGLLPPANQRAHVQIMTYLRARLRTGGSVVDAYKGLIRSGSLDRLARVNRYFWRISILLPPPVLRKAFWIVHGGSPLKQWVWKLRSIAG